MVIELTKEEYELIRECIHVEIVSLETEETNLGLSACEYKREQNLIELLKTKFKEID